MWRDKAPFVFPEIVIAMFSGGGSVLLMFTPLWPLSALMAFASGGAAMAAFMIWVDR